MPLRSSKTSRPLEELLAAPSSIIISVLIMMLLTLPILYNTGQPKGWDTPRYYYYARYVDENNSLPETDRPLTIILMFLLYKLFFLFGDSVMVFLTFSQIAFFTLYVISAYKFSLSMTDNTDVAFLSTILAPLFTTTLRSQALLSGLLSQSLIMFSISYLSDYIARGRRRDLLKALGLFILSATANAWYTFYFLLISGTTFIVLLCLPPYRPKIIGLIKRYLLLLPLVCLGLAIPFLFRPELLVDMVNVFKLGVDPRTAIEYNWRRIWSIFGGISLALGVIGIPFIPKYIRSRVLRIFVLTWAGLSLFMSFFVMTVAFYRPLIIFPFYFTGSLPLHAYVMDWSWSSRSGQPKPRLGRAKPKILPTVVAFFIIGGLLLQAMAWQRTFLGPYLRPEDLDDLLWLRDHVRGKAIICITRVERDQVFWCEAFLESLKREIYLFYGNLTDLLSGQVRVSPGYTDYYFVNKALVENRVVDRLWEFTIILPAFTYDLGVEKALLRKVPGREIYYLEVDSKEQLMAYYEALLTLSKVRIGQLGWEYHLMVELLRDMGLKCDRLGGQSHLPPLEELRGYDLIIMNSLYELNDDDIEGILGLTGGNTSLIMTGWTANRIYERNARAFELLLGATWSDGLSDAYSCVLYNKSHPLTAHMLLPHITEGPVSPIGGLTNGLGFGLVNNRTDLYALVMNERGGSRVAAFGKLIEHMDWYERTMLKKLILWALHIDLDLLVPKGSPRGLDIRSSAVGGFSVEPCKPYTQVGPTRSWALVVEGIPDEGQLPIGGPGYEGSGHGVPIQQRD